MSLGGQFFASGAGCLLGALGASSGLLNLTFFAVLDVGKDLFFFLFFFFGVGLVCGFTLDSIKGKVRKGGTVSGFPRSQGQGLDLKTTLL